MGKNTPSSTSHEQFPVTVSRTGYGMMTVFVSI
jgi:hypothetical protein